MSVRPILVAACFGFVALACATSTTAWRMRIRGTSTEFTVEGALPRGGYLDVALAGRSPLRTFLADTADCRRIAKRGEKVRYVWDGALGALAEPVGSRSCQVVGIGSLPEWRLTRPEDTGLESSQPVPREVSKYRVV